jgi:hypothetical protein
VAGQLRMAGSIASILPTPTPDIINGLSLVDDELPDSGTPAVAAAAGTQLLVYSRR